MRTVQVARFQSEGEQIMTKLRKSIVIGLAAAGLGIASVSAFANKEHCGPMGHDSANYGAWMEKHQSRLHDKLKLTADQEAAWTAFVGKMAPVASAAKPDWSALSALPAPERMEQMVSRMKEREAQMEQRLAALKEFYAVLTPEQQKLFDAQHGRRGRHG
jgi:protein CpxP